MTNLGRHVSPADHQQPSVDEQAESGRHASGRDVVRKALRHREDAPKWEEAHLAYLAKLTEHGEAAYARGDYAQVAREGLGRFVRGIGERAVSRHRTGRGGA